MVTGKGCHGDAAVCGQIKAAIGWAGEGCTCHCAGSKNTSFEIEIFKQSRI